MVCFRIWPGLVKDFSSGFIPQCKCSVLSHILPTYSIAPISCLADKLNSSQWQAKHERQSHVFFSLFFMLADWRCFYYNFRNHVISSVVLHEHMHVVSILWRASSPPLPGQAVHHFQVKQSTTSRSIMRKRKGVIPSLLSGTGTAPTGHSRVTRKTDGYFSLCLILNHEMPGTAVHRTGNETFL